MKKFFFAVMALMCVMISSCSDGKTGNRTDGYTFEDLFPGVEKSSLSRGEKFALFANECNIEKSDDGLAIVTSKGTKYPVSGWRYINTGDKPKSGDKIRIYDFAQVKNRYYIYCYDDADKQGFNKWRREHGKKIK